MKEKEDKLLKEKPFKLMLELSVPAIIGMVIIGLYPLMDGIFAGQILGNQAMTAVGIAMPMTFINSGISTLIGVGSASILSRAIGRKDQQTIDKINGKHSRLVKLAIQGTGRNWKLKQKQLSGHYTTDINQIISINCTYPTACQRKQYS